MQLNKKLVDNWKSYIIYVSLDLLIMTENLHLVKMEVVDPDPAPNPEPEPQPEPEEPEPTSEES